MVVIGIDFGNRRIGVAVSESGVLATPHSIITHRGDMESVMKRIATLAHDLHADRIVVGVPRRLQGAPPRKYGEFRTLLATVSGLPVELWDESYTTTAASSLRRERGTARGSRDPIDHEAAAVMLQSYLDTRGAGA